MMETESPRHVTPSRYKTIRRKPAAITTDSGTSSASNSQRQQAPPSRKASQPEPQAEPHRHRHNQRPLVDLAAGGHVPADPQQQQHESRFRKILRLNTIAAAKDQAASPASQPNTAPPVFHHDRHRKLAKQTPVREEKSEEDIKKEKAREEAFAALEGKKRRNSKAVKKVEEEAYDLKVQLHHDKHGLITVPILNDTDAATLLEKVRPGHERCLLEMWPSLGIMRQVRYFETVVDVINTWDVGASSHIRMGKNVWGQTNRTLEEFPSSEPVSGEVIFHYYVKADKKWSKRAISVENNAVKIMKKDKPYDKDYIQTISLDSFDIYMFSDPFIPNKQLKCPTKYCFTLKSQHKQSLFAKNSVFAHYFAIDDEDRFIRWYNFIRDAKARLIAEKMGIAPWAPSSQPESRGGDGSGGSKDATAPPSPGRGRRAPGPLISPEEFAKPPSDVQRSKSLHRGKSVKRTVKDRSASAAPKSAGLVGSLEQEVFSPGGLLGSDYEEKKRVALKQYKEERTKDGILQSKSTAMRNDGGRHRHPGPHDASPTEDAICSVSIKSQSSGKGRGLQRRGTEPSPPSTGAAKEQGTLLTFAAHEINTSLPHRQIRTRAQSVSDRHALSSTGKKKTGHLDDEPSPFTGTGLLASKFKSAGTATYGHGVRTGRDAVNKNGEINPLMDMNQRSMFAPGSLLARREKEIGPTGPVIDRDPHSDSEDQ